MFKICRKYNPRFLFLLFINTLIAPIATQFTLILSPLLIDTIFLTGETAPPQGLSRYVRLFVDAVIRRPEGGLAAPDYGLGVKYMIMLLVSILVTGLIQSIITNRLQVERMLIYKSFRLELARRLMSVRYERTETADFLDLKAKADQYITSGGAGFAQILDTAFGLFSTILTMAVYVDYLRDYLKEHGFALILLVLLLTGISIWLNYRLSRKNIEINLEKSVQERRTGYFALLSHHFKFGKEIRGSGCSDWVSDRYTGQMNVLQRFYEKISHYGIKYGALMLFANVAQRAVTYGYLIGEARSGQVASAGVFSSMLQAIEGLSSGLKGLVGGIASLNQYNKYYESFKELYTISEYDALPDADTVPMPSLDSQMTIRFEDVSFRYPGSESDALSHISCEIGKNDIISIVGDNGAGKSTFIKLLLRLYEPSSGRITLNGTDIARIDRKEYAARFACVFQDFQLLSFSVRDNITLGLDEDDPECSRRVDGAIAFAGLTEKIASLEKGTDTMIYREFDPNGYTPSGGESQRLALARAVYRDSDILILDEPTAALDPNIEYELNNRIRSELHGKKTIINVSHRLHSVRYSSQIFVFREGRLIESGTHKELFARDSVYHQMFERQASDYVDMSQLQ
ncbi:MAG: ABC transporter ATP-binding protein [Lachnospiraceae bacterium]|nr:ABC transporter ATP-binding protein [Lachnospiraceae bacterium]